MEFLNLSFHITLINVLFRRMNNFVLKILKKSYQTAEYPILFQIKQSVNFIKKQFDSKKKEYKMDTYLTPQKENMPKQSRTLPNNRLSDWVCVVCNNLNFSFRKKCNRCKTQTRHQNELATAYSQYYYEQLPQPPIQYQQNQTPFYEFRNSYLPDDEKYSRNTKQSYNKQRKEKGNSTAARSSGAIQDNRKDVFGCDLWKQLEVRDFQEFCHESQEQECVNTHAFNDRELQNLINKILL